MTRELPIVVNEMLRYRVGSAKATEVFQSLRHNDDLVPRVHVQLETLLQSYVKYEAITYDVQGVHDLGSDVVLKFYPEGKDEGEGWKVIAFQVKSYHDLKRKNYLKDLRSQFVQAQDEYGDRLEQYVILLCTDVNEHLNKVREISKAFSKTRGAVVIHPTHAVGFLRLRSIHVNLIVDQFQRSDDIVLSHAKEYVGNLSPTRSAVVLALAHHGVHSIEAIREHALAGDPFLADVYHRVPDWDFAEMEAEKEDEEEAEAEESKAFFDEATLAEFSAHGRASDERFREDLDALIGDMLTTRYDADGLYVDPGAGLPLKAILLDIEVRYDTHGADLLRHVFGMLGVMERYGIDVVPLSWEEEDR